MIRLDDHDLLQLSPKQRRHIIGLAVTIAFPNLMTRPNPNCTVGFQVSEPLTVHQPGNKAQMRRLSP